MRCWRTSNSAWIILWRGRLPSRQYRPTIADSDRATSAILINRSKKAIAGLKVVWRYETVSGHSYRHGFVEDVAEAVVLAVTQARDAGRIYNVGEAETPTWAERIAEIGRVAGWKGRIVPVPAAELPESQRYPADFTHHLAIDSTRIRAELGYAEIVSREEALRRTIAWERGAR